MKNKGAGLFRSVLFKGAFLMLSVLLFSTGCTKIIRVSDRAEIEMPELVGDMKRVKIVFIGELHNEKWHHDAQLSVIKALHEAGVPVAIGLEMFLAEDQETLDKWVDGEFGRDAFIDFYYANWHIPWSNYRDILYYARDNKIPVIGLNVSREIIHEVFSKGFSSLTPEQLAKLPPDIKCDIDPTYEEFIRKAMEDHEGSEESFKKFCEAQMVWDSAMAKNTLDYMAANPDTMVVVLAGSGHSWKRGIPEQVKRRSGAPFLVILPEMDRLDNDSVTVDDADYLWLDF